jgi:hypothetical protein
MPSRADMDRPATVTAALLGVVLIAVSAPFLASSGSGATSYDISWTQVVAASKSQQNAGANTDATAIVTVTGLHPSNATITFETCTDGATPPLQQPATITWSLKQGATVIKDNQQASCANNGPFTVALHSHPDVGSAEGRNATEAARSAEEHDATYSYTLTFRYSRPAGNTGPIPLPPPPFSTNGKVEVKAWHAIANTPPQEGGR